MHALGTNGELESQACNSGSVCHSPLETHQISQGHQIPQGQQRRSSLYYIPRQQPMGGSLQGQWGSYIPRSPAPQQPGSPPRLSLAPRCGEVLAVVPDQVVAILTHPGQCPLQHGLLSVHLDAPGHNCATGGDFAQNSGLESPVVGLESRRWFGQQLLRGR